MFSKLTAVFAIVAAAAVSAQGTINTPASLTQCVPTSLSWTVTNGPFYLSIIPGGQPSAAPLLDFGQVTSSPITWSVNITSGTSIGLKLVDASGAPFYSEAVTIMPGTSDSCLSGAAAVSGSSSAAASGASSMASSASASASSAVGGVAGAASSVAASASNVVSSVRASASNVVSSVSGAASSAANSASQRATGVTSAAAGAASTAAGGASKIESTGLLAAALAIVAVAAL